MGVHRSGAVLQSPLHPLHHARRNTAASPLPANYMRLKGRPAFSHSHHHSTLSAIGSLPKARLFLTNADLPRKTRPMTAPVHTYRIRPRCVRRNRISPHFHQHPVHLGQLQSFLSGPRFDGYNASVCTATPLKSPPIPLVSDRSEEAEDLDLEIDLDGNDHGNRRSDLPGPKGPKRHPTPSHALHRVTAEAKSSSATSASSSSPSFPPTPLDTDPQQRQELMMLKREAFQELASQTQRFDDMFIAKMIYWEGLSSEEKAQWLERGRQSTTCQEVGSKEVYRRPGQHQHHHEHPHRPKSCSDDRREQDEIDELVNALECRATVKDYSALIAFERQAELDQQRRQVARTTALDMPLYN